MTTEQKLPCSCYAETDADGYIWITAEGFLCEARHKQGDLVEVREGLALVPGRRARMDLSRGGHMDLNLAPDASPETIEALRNIGEAALDRMIAKERHE